MMKIKKGKGTKKCVIKDYKNYLGAAQIERKTTYLRKKTN